jgi:hypothetical protein
MPTDNPTPGEVETLLRHIRAVKTMPELIELRYETGRLMSSGGPDTFRKIQDEFRKAKNRLRRIPLRDRTW